MEHYGEETGSDEQMEVFSKTISFAKVKQHDT